MMLRGIVMTEDQGDERKTLNNPETHINRGVELLLRNRRRKTRTAQNFSDKVW